MSLMASIETILDFGSCQVEVQSTRYTNVTLPRVCAKRATVRGVPVIAEI